METEAAVLWGQMRGLAGRDHHARPAQGRRGPGPDRGVGHVPQRRAPAHRRPRAASTRSSAATRAPASSRRSDPGSTTSSPGDHVVFGFVPACGKCPSCARGRSNLCDVGAMLMMGTQIDGTYRHHAADGSDIGTMVCLGHLRQAHRRQQGVVREDPRPLPVGQGLPRRLRGHHRLGLGRVRRRGPAGRRRGRHRHRWHRRLGPPGRPPGRGRAHLRHRPGAVEARDGRSSSVPPTPARQHRGGHGAGQRGHLGQERRQGDLHHGRGRRAG